MANEMLNNVQKPRIGSIDAVRAIILLGILIVHTNFCFGFQMDYTNNIVDNILYQGVNIFLNHKCAIVFNIMFGVSFYFILKKPSYPGEKFIWRCVLLFFFGLFNKLFYTYDALCLYAFWGIVLVAFRRVKPKYLIMFVIALKLLSHYLATFKFGNRFIEYTDTRYSFDYPFLQILAYPHALIDYVKIILNGGVVSCLTNFLLGYWIARIGMIDRLEQISTKKNLLITLIVFIVVMALKIPFKWIRPLLSLAGGAFYAMLVLYSYYNVAFLRSPLHYLESYGRLGLTNYSLQSLAGVTICYFFYNTPIVQHLSLLLLVMFSFYGLQAYASHKWLETHKFGPLEYLWRSLTDMKFMGNIKVKQ